MTPEQKLRAADEAEKLAGECAEGTAPPMARYDRHPNEGGHCALGWIEVRAELGLYALPASDWSIVEGAIVADANNEPGEHDEQLAHLVIPLLAYADALRESAAAGHAP